MKRKEFNENYFNKIDSEDKAYFLGFILADGSIVNKNNRYSLVININDKDIKVLKTFKEKINYEGDIWYHKQRSNMCQIKVSSKILINDLSKYFIIPNKTNIVKYPEIPDELQNHFIRGVFDGDGCISIHKENREGCGVNRGQFNICSGSKEFIYEYVEKLIILVNVKRNKIINHNNRYYTIDWAGFTDIENLYKFLYNNATIYLDRKKKTFDEIYNISINNKKYRKK